MLCHQQLLQFRLSPHSCPFLINCFTCLLTLAASCIILSRNAGFNIAFNIAGSSVNGNAWCGGLTSFFGELFCSAKTKSCYLGYKSDSLHSVKACIIFKMFTSHLFVPTHNNFYLPENLFIKSGELLSDLHLLLKSKGRWSLPFFFLPDVLAE